MSSDIYREEKLLVFLHRAANFSRADFALAEPTFRRDLGMLCRINYIGPRFRRGGVAMIGHSSGSGEKRGEEAFAARDSTLVPQMRAFRESGSSQALADLMDAEGRETRCWRLWWAIEGTISRLGCDFDEIAITNVLPFTVYDAEGPTLRRSDCPTWRKAVRDFLQPWLRATGAGTVIWLGKRAYKKASHHWPDVPAHAVIDRDRGITRAQAFEDLDEKIASRVIAIVRGAKGLSPPAA
jgi:hypothetical protein